MDSMMETIEEYKNTCNGLLSRVKELDRLIALAGQSVEGICYTRRRSILYIEIWDLQRAIRDMEEYVDILQSGARCAEECHISAGVPENRTA